MSRAKDEMENQEAEVQIPKEVAVLPSGETVIYPEMVIPLAAGEEKMIKLIDDVLSGDKILGLFAQRPGGEGSSADNIFSVGTATAVARMFKMPDGSIRAFLQGMKRIKIKKIIQTEPYIRAQIKIIEEKLDKTPELEALTRNLTDLFQKIVVLSPNLPEEIGVAVINIAEPGRLADFVAAHINLSLEEKQGILEELNIRKRSIGNWRFWSSAVKSSPRLRVNLIKHSGNTTFGNNSKQYKESSEKWTSKPWKLMS